MDPISSAIIAAIAGAGVAGTAGWLAGSRRTQTPDPTPDTARTLPETPQTNQREEELEAENTKLRQLFGLERFHALSDTLRGHTLDALRAQLTGFHALKNTRAAAILDEDGLVLVGDEDDDSVTTLASLAGGVAAAGLWSALEADTMHWHGEAGDYLTLARHTSGAQSCVVAVWSQGMEAPREIFAKTRYAFEGMPPKTTAGRRALRDGDFDPDPTSQVIERIAESLPLRGALLRAKPGIDLLSIRPSERTQAFAQLDVLWSFIDAFSTHRRHLSAPLGVIIEGNGLQISAQHFSSPKGHDCRLFLELDAATPWPSEHLEQWTGQLAWQIPNLIENHPTPLRDDVEEQMVASP